MHINSHSFLHRRLTTIGLILIVAAGAFTALALLGFVPSHKTIHITTGATTAHVVTTNTNSHAKLCPSPYGKPPHPCSWRPPPPPPVAHVSCTKNGLREKSMWSGAMMGINPNPNGASPVGYGGESIVLVNTTNTPCYLTPPPMTVTTTTGEIEPVSLANRNFTPHRVNIQPGGSIQMFIGDPGTCYSPAKMVSSLALSLPGGTMTFKGLYMSIQCGQPQLMDFWSPSRLPGS